MLNDYLFSEFNQKLDFLSIKSHHREPFIAGTREQNVRVNLKLNLEDSASVITRTQRHTIPSFIGFVFSVSAGVYLVL